MTDSAYGGFPLFIDAVSRRSGLPIEQAAAVARAVLQTMAERVTGGVPDDLAGHLPDEVDGYLTGPDLAPDAAAQAGRDLAPDPAGPDWAPDPAAAPRGPDPGVDGLSIGGPDTGVDGLSIGGHPGVDGLDTGVGLDVGGPVAAPPPDAGPTEFLRRVGQRAAVDQATARAGTGAVFATLREAVTVREFREMVARLPRDGEGGAASVPPGPYGT
ncbi:DUF2267 domain-containing protein [Micromonospora sp. NPDC005413]|uniref:DUF2267 domain-containing protein n=1 Tax=Micromonospora sp. NPDC005413 TaxID=3154563 RepID=UPI0033ABCF12